MSLKGAETISLFTASRIGEELKKQENEKKSGKQDRKKSIFIKILFATSILLAIGIFFTSIEIVETYWALVSLGYLLSWTLLFLFAKPKNSTELQKEIDRQNIVISDLTRMYKENADTINYLRNENLILKLESTQRK